MKLEIFLTLATAYRELGYKILRRIRDWFEEDK